MLAPPKVNDGAADGSDTTGASVVEAGFALCAGPEGLAKSSSALWGGVGGITSGTGTTGVSRAGAGALAVPLPKLPTGPSGAPTKTGRTAETGVGATGGFGAGGADGVILLTAGGVMSALAAAAAEMRAASSISLCGAKPELAAAWASATLITGLGAGGGAGRATIVDAGTTVAASFAGRRGLVGAGCAGAVAAAGGVAAASAASVTVVACAPGFPGSPLRKSPRATRKVPLDCSTLIGLVRTRLAPMRNAFATPA